MRISIFRSIGLLALSIVLIAAVNIGAGAKEKTGQAGVKKMAIQKEPFGKTAEGQEVFLYTLTNEHGMKVKITNYGGIVTELWVPDRTGKPGDVVLGFSDLKGYLAGHPYFGALIGRYGNRIARGRFTLDEKEYVLVPNNGNNHLHGGIRGFDKVVWKATMEEIQIGPSLRLNYRSKDGEEGYPGNLEVMVDYIVTRDNELRIDYRARTDRPTVVNLTHHSYFNLAGAGSGDILGHELTVNADLFTAIDKELIPTGVLQPVAGTPLDFRNATPIGARIGQLEGGYDHNFVLNRKGSAMVMEMAARLYDPGSGRAMEVWTTEPGLQFYSGNFLDGTITGKQGKVYARHAGLCLETQHFPDSPNRPDFPTTTLRPGQVYQQETVYRFSQKK